MEFKTISISDQNRVLEVVDMHLQVLKESFLNNFGAHFLKIIYTNLLDCPDTIFIIATENNRLIGFALAMTDYSKFLTTALKKDRSTLLLEIGWTLLKNPTTAFKLSFSLPGILLSSSHPHAELQFIAISPLYQGCGVGTQILSHLARELSSRKIKAYYVGTKAENTLSNQFYRKLGFQFSHSKKYFGDLFNYYVSPGLHD